jgi:hypothetical protein
MRFADEELERARLETEADPFADAELEVEGEVATFAGAPVARELTQVPAVVDDVQVRQARAFNQGQDVAVELLFGIGRGRAVKLVLCAGADLVQRLGCLPVQFNRFKQAFHTVTPFAHWRFTIYDCRFAGNGVVQVSCTGALEHSCALAPKY